MCLFFKKNQTIDIPLGGLIPSPLDKRDVLTAEIIPEIKRIPKEVPCAFDLEILNQGNTPACVGFSGAGMKQHLEARERINKVFDGLWLYQECKKIDGMPEVRGTYLRAVLKVLQKKGAKPLDEPESEAGKYKIGGYAQVNPLTWEELRKVIAVYNVVLSGFTGSNQGWQTGNIRPPKAGENTWGHAVFSESYTENNNGFQNSWGIKWGNNGKGCYNKEYLPFEAWIVLNDLPFDYLINKQEGWVAENWVKLGMEEGTVLTTTERLNFRTEPSTSGSSVIRTLDKGEKITYQGERIKSGNYYWLRVKA